jgi:hypothetical protein
MICSGTQSIAWIKKWFVGTICLGDAIQIGISREQIYERKKERSGSEDRITLPWNLEATHSKKGLLVAGSNRILLAAIERFG